MKMMENYSYFRKFCYFNFEGVENRILWINLNDMCLWFSFLVFRKNCMLYFEFL